MRIRGLSILLRYNIVGVEWMESESGWVNGECWIDWIKRSKASNAPWVQPGSLLIFDVYSSHRTQESFDLLKNCGCTVRFVPGNCTAIAQPLDIMCMRFLKRNLADQHTAFETKLFRANQPYRLPMDIEFLQQISNAWAAVTVAVIQKAFEKSGALPVECLQGSYLSHCMGLRYVDPLFRHEHVPPLRLNGGEGRAVISIVQTLAPNGCRIQPAGMSTSLYAHAATNADEVVSNVADESSDIDQERHEQQVNVTSITNGILRTFDRSGFKFAKAGDIGAQEYSIYMCIMLDRNITYVHIHVVDSRSGMKITCELCRDLNYPEVHSFASTSLALYGCNACWKYWCTLCSEVALDDKSNVCLYCLGYLRNDLHTLEADDFCDVERGGEVAMQDAEFVMSTGIANVVDQQVAAPSMQNLDVHANMEATTTHVLDAASAAEQCHAAPSAQLSEEVVTHGLSRRKRGRPRKGNTSAAAPIMIEQSQVQSSRKHVGGRPRIRPSYIDHIQEPTTTASCPAATSVPAPNVHPTVPAIQQLQYIIGEASKKLPDTSPSETQQLLAKLSEDVNRLTMLQSLQAATQAPQPVTAAESADADVIPTMEILRNNGTFDIVREPILLEYHPLRRGRLPGSRSTNKKNKAIGTIDNEDSTHQRISVHPPESDASGEDQSEDMLQEKECACPPSRILEACVQHEVDEGLRIPFIELKVLWENGDETTEPIANFVDVDCNQGDVICSTEALVTYAMHHWKDVPNEEVDIEGKLNEEQLKNINHGITRVIRKVAGGLAWQNLQKKPVRNIDSRRQ